MECTQRLECTQDLYDSRPERICPEQIGFLGICGVKHPVKRGPNKIGRDPQTCSIVLNLNSISRQHAVINVLNQREYMLMDLDSANKTKLMEKTLPPYIPHPLKDGDMVQFGDIFGVFRLLEEDTDLPMTQAIDMPDTQVPETPISKHHISKVNKNHKITIPESPDVSDKDDSFIVPSQPKGDKCFRNSSSHFIKPSSKVISIQPVGTNKIDNIYWNSSKKSVSLNSQFDDSSSSKLNDSVVSDKPNANKSNDKSIFEMETQPPEPCEADKSTDSIYTASTQIPPAIHIANTQVPTSIHMLSTQDPSSIHNADTQVPTTMHNLNTQLPTSIHTENTQAPCTSPSIHSINTQLPPSITLPEVCKIDSQKEMRFDLCTFSNNNIFDAETQNYALVGDQDVKINKINKETNNTNQKTPINVSAEEILFEEMECQDFENNFESQALLPPDNMTDTKKDKCSNQPKNNKNNKVIVDSDSSTDCEDIDMLPTQNITKVTEKPAAADEDITDCEDSLEDEPKLAAKDVKKVIEVTKNVNFEDMLTQVITLDDKEIANVSVNKIQTTHGDNFEDMLTQVIPPCENKPTTSTVNLVNFPTQIIVDDSEDVIVAEKPVDQPNTRFEDLPTQIIRNNKPIQNIDQELVSPFKIPLTSPLKAKRKDSKVITPKSNFNLNKISPIISDDNYYAATQDILDDLCSQPDILPNDVVKEDADQPNDIDDDFLPSSVEDYKIGNKFPHLENNPPPKKSSLNNSFDSSDGDDNVNSFVFKLSSQQIRDVIGVESVDKIKRVPSDPSDIELTPKKVRPIKFMDIDLPNSQEIKTSVLTKPKTPVTESSSESEVENDSEESTPTFLCKKKKKSKANAKVDLTKVFAESLPTRVITRVRKPTTKFQNEDTKKMARNILKPNFITEQEDVIDKDIVTENITRLKSKLEKNKIKEISKDPGQELKKGGKVKEESKVDEKENGMDMVIATTSKNDSNCTVKSNKSPKNIDDIDTGNTTSGKSKPKEKSKGQSNKNNRKVPKKELNDKKSKTDIDEHKVSVNVTNDSQVNNLTVETSIESKPTRSTRSRRKVNEQEEKQYISVEEDSQNDKKSKPTRRKQNKKKTIEIDLTDEGVETRRSSRQKPANEQTESKVKIEKRETKADKESDKAAKPAARRGRPPKNAVKAEQSTIYSLSSESGPDTPKSILKRPATESLDPPCSKRTRSAVNSSVTLRGTPARVNKTQRVLFTAFPSEEVKTKLERLGAVVVSDVRECSMVLTMAVKRTFKLLCAVGLGRPVVGPGWVQACVDNGVIVDPWLYILKDEVAEKRFQFSLERTLSGKRNFLQGFHVSSTPSVLPNSAELKLIVECSGGTWQEGGPQWICVSCLADKALWPALRRRGAEVVSTEFILGGVLRQRPDITKNKLG